MLISKDSEKKSRWYFGGLASAGSAFCTQPLDLLKVIYQTDLRTNVSMFQLSREIVRDDGVCALFNGVSAAVLRQLTYSTTRFAIYELGKQTEFGKESGFLGRVVMAAIGGTVGGFVGSPADLINVRMQNDIKRPPALRRNYKNAFDGIVRVWREEGFRRLFAGASSATARSVFMTIGQLTFYDQAKYTLFQTGYFTDNIGTHFLAALIAGGMATTMTQPIDMVKTVMMNAKPGEFNSIGAILVHIGQLGPLGFFKGFIPRFIRLGPHTVLTFIFLEQLRIHFGVVESR
ncbi:mitochondrial dicarboxylate carrier-like [Anopheles ziemanni]|uniref:mitochondrial dicarboxylate carrier-like n=1 Tax=Anopheles coustani TaxID=139045 RepID=UPI00265B6396|nr:mitochondrial dicarboxylate carrier-like [Anopheles coustani]XP_058118476.1 mitochondrial dicarboxylate carrier-like [Anopheles coustani]XP_058168930.1 mitochondrial dicarboxylate carrier-like [Anopheles ziemanni]